MSCIRMSTQRRESAYIQDATRRESSSPSTSVFVKPARSFCNLRHRVHPLYDNAPVQRIGYLNNRSAEIAPSSAFFAQYPKQIAYAAANIAARNIPTSLPPTSAPGYSASAGTFSFVGLLFSAGGAVIDALKLRRFSKKFSPRAQNKEDRKLEKKQYRWGIAGYVVSFFGNFLNTIGNGTASIVSFLRLFGVGTAVTTGGHVILRMSGVLLGLVGSVISFGVEIGKAIYYAIASHLLNKKIKKIKAQRAEREALIANANTNRSAELLKKFIKLQEKGFTGGKTGKKSFKHLLVLSVFNIGGTGSAVVVGGLLVAGTLGAGALTGGLAALPLIFFLPWFVYSIKMARRGHKEKKEEKAVQKAFELAQEKERTQAASIQELAIIQGWKKYYLKQVSAKERTQQVTHEIRRLNVEIAEYHCLIEQHKKQYYVIADELKKLEQQTIGTHPWLLASDILQILCNPQTSPADARWMKEALRKCYLRKPEEFDPWFQLIQHLYESHEFTSAMYHLLYGMELPKNHYFRVDKKQKMNLSNGKVPTAPPFSFKEISPVTA